MPITFMKSKSYESNLDAFLRHTIITRTQIQIQGPCNLAFWRMSKLGLNFGHYNSEALFWRQSIHITVFGLRYWLLRDNYVTKYELSNVAYIPDRHHKKIFQFQSFTQYCSWSSHVSRAAKPGCKPSFITKYIIDFNLFNVVKSLKWACLVIPEQGSTCH